MQTLTPPWEVAKGSQKGVTQRSQKGCKTVFSTLPTPYKPRFFFALGTCGRKNPSFFRLVRFGERTHLRVSGQGGGGIRVFRWWLKSFHVLNLRRSTQKGPLQLEKGQCVFSRSDKTGVPEGLKFGSRRSDIFKSSRSF